MEDGLSLFLGGLAAPLFFFVLGAGTGLAHARKPPSTLAFRGLEIIVWGYLLRFQIWALDYGALVGEVDAWTALLTALLGIGWLVALWGLRRRDFRGLSGLILVVGSLALLPPQARTALTRVDVLQTLGLTLLLLSGLERRLWPPHRLLFAALFLVGVGCIQMAVPVGFPDALLGLHE